ncbi:MAG: Omp28-related outer membrane protein [Saprospiraceae bacterium]|nr:Omp28-related outer membrane protein [Saprospiraceae bacterium]
MKNKKVIALSFILTLCLSSCSDWEQTVNLPDNNAVESKRVVLLEEFTGVSCVNCPAGIAISNAIADAYPNNVVLVGIHSRFLAQPATKGQVDLRLPDAQSIEDFLGDWLAKPEAAINRLYSTQAISYRYGNPDSWKGIVEAELLKEVEFELTIKPTYNEATRELNVTLNAKALKDINKPIHLHCGITQSGIIADQLNNQSPKIVNFEHNHVLLKMLSAISGDRISTSAIANSSYTKTYTFTMPTDSILWKTDHCNVFGYVSLDENEKYILQAAEAPLK